MPASLSVRRRSAERSVPRAVPENASLSPGKPVRRADRRRFDSFYSGRCRQGVRDGVSVDSLSIGKQKKNRRHAREPLRPQSARRRSCSPPWSLRHPATDPPAAQPPCTAAKPRVIAGVPVDAVGREIEGIGAVIGISLASQASTRRLIAGRATVYVKTTVTDESDRLTQGSRDGGEKAFIIMKRHLRIPSPFGDRGKHRRRASPPAREHVRIGNMLPDR